MEQVLRVRLTFTDEVLGTAASDPEIHETYIASKAPDAKSLEEEVAAVGVDEVVEKGKTIFPRDKDGTPVFFDYQIRGFFKEACGALRQDKTKKSSKVKAYKKLVDNQVFVFPDADDHTGRMIRIETAGAVGDCQRPLRAQTMQGERVALANSETVPAGSWCEFDVVVPEQAQLYLVQEWLDYGRKKGIGQWRNSGKGTFTWQGLGVRQLADPEDQITALLKG